MRRCLFALAVLLAAPVSAQVEISNAGGIRFRDPESVTAQRPACTPDREGVRHFLTDASTVGDCAAGGGSARAGCVCRSGEWVSVAADYRVELLRTGCEDGEVPIASGGALTCGTPPAGPQGAQGPPGDPGPGASPCAAWPVDSIFIGATATSPAVSLGCGTWAAFGSGRVLVGFDAGQAEFDTAGETGGAKTHTLTAAELPAHTHVVTSQTATTGGATSYEHGTLDASSAENEATEVTGSTGGGVAHNNLQPYLVAWFWRRTA